MTAPSIGLTESRLAGVSEHLRSALVELDSVKGSLGGDGHSAAVTIQEDLEGLIARLDRLRWAAGGSDERER